MYPKLSDLINDIFGTDINLPVQSYGFFVALAFIIAGYLLYYELKRREKTGLLVSTKKKVWKGKPATYFELTVSVVVGILIGYKVLGLFKFYSFFADHPQEYLFSLKGSWIGGLLIGGASAIYTYFNKEASRLEEPVLEEVEIHPYQHTGSIILIAAIAGIIGAKIFHQLENWGDFINDPWGSLLSFSGLTFYGGLIAGTLAVIYYAEKNSVSWIVLGDSIAPSLMIAYGIGRIGCQVSGDGDWGIVNTTAKPGWLNWLPDWAWAYDYPHNILKQGELIPGCTGEYCYRLSEPVFPTPIYETLICLILFAILWFLRKRLAIPGLLFSIYLIFNGIERFFIEKIRVNTKYNIFNFEITQAEIISFVLIVAGILGIWYFRKRFNKKLQKV